MRILFAGSGAFGLPSLAAMVEGGHEVVGVYTQPDRPAGRGRKTSPTPIGEFALERGLNLVRTEDLNLETLPAADVLVVIAFGQKVAQAVASRPAWGSVNLHASLLPRHRGAAPVNWAILSGDRMTGNSVIRLAERMDAGAVLGQSPVEIEPLETAGELHDRLAVDGAALLLKTLESLAAGGVAGGGVAEVMQDEAMATRAGRLSREMAVVDWAGSAEQCARTIRGLFPWPGCRVSLTDSQGTETARMTLVRARPVAGEGPRWLPGEIDLAHYVTTGDGNAVEIMSVQPEGGRVMSLSDYRRGHAWLPGMRLQSNPKPQ